MTGQLGLAFPELTANKERGSASTDLGQTVSELLGAPFVAVVEKTFAYVATAEEEIADYMRRFPILADKRNAAFRNLCWYLDIPAPEPVYQHHARELLQRVVDAKSLKRGTEAEALMCLCVTSLDAPLRTEAMIGAVKLFRRMYGDVGGVTDREFHEPWPGASDELLDTIVSKLSRNRDCRK